MPSGWIIVSCICPTEATRALVKYMGYKNETLKSCEPKKVQYDVVTTECKSADITRVDLSAESCKNGWARKAMAQHWHSSCNGFVSYKPSCMAFAGMEQLEKLLFAGAKSILQTWKPWDNIVLYLVTVGLLQEKSSCTLLLLGYVSY